MLVKVILIFLLVMGLVGMIGKVLFPGMAQRLVRRRVATCPKCGRPRIGRRECDCGGKA